MTKDVLVQAAPAAAVGWVLIFRPITTGWQPHIEGFPLLLGIWRTVTKIVGTRAGAVRLPHSRTAPYSQMGKDLSWNNLSIYMAF